MFVILGVSTGAKEKGITAGLAIGSVIALEALFAGPITGDVDEPGAIARAGPRLRRLERPLDLCHRPLCRRDARDPGLPMCSRAGVLHGRLRDRHMNATKRLLFVCVENANRSQMAEAFARMLGGSAVEAFSAGSRPSGIVNPKAIESMREMGYDLSAHGSKSLDDLPQVEFDFVATMGCGDACPHVRAKRRADWAIPDPKHLPPEEFRTVRDLIRERVRAALLELGVEPAELPAERQP